MPSPPPSPSSSSSSWRTVGEEGAFLLLFRFPLAFRLLAFLLAGAGATLPDRADLPADESESDAAGCRGDGSEPESSSCVLAWRADCLACRPSASLAGELELGAPFPLFSPPLGQVMAQLTP